MSNRIDQFLQQEEAQSEGTFKIVYQDATGTTRPGEMEVPDGTTIGDLLGVYFPSYSSKAHSCRIRRGDEVLGSRRHQVDMNTALMPNDRVIVSPSKPEMA